MNDECGFDEVIKVATALKWKPGVSFRAVTTMKYFAASHRNNSGEAFSKATSDLTSFRAVCATPMPFHKLASSKDSKRKSGLGEQFFTNHQGRVNSAS